MVKQLIKEFKSSGKEPPQPSRIEIKANQTRLRGLPPLKVSEETSLGVFHEREVELY